MSAFRISFEVPGNPVPKQRAQVGSHGAYYPARSPRSKRLSYPEYRELVQRECRLVLWGVKGVTSHQYDAWRIGAWGLKVTAWVGAGDGDNIIGSVADALSGILWENDKQVAHWECNVIRTTPKQYRGATVEAWVLEEKP